MKLRHRDKRDLDSLLRLNISWWLAFAIVGVFSDVGWWWVFKTAGVLTVTSVATVGVIYLRRDPR